tara:strand:- start:1305 stop:1415 length:111 start_codon:yes stop_codon:yes gene_type:complete
MMKFGACIVSVKQKQALIRAIVTHALSHLLSAIVVL